MTMKREALRSHLHNPALAQIIKAKQDADKVRKQLRDAVNIMNQLRISDVAVQEVFIKVEVYNKINHHYGCMLEDIFGVSWHWESTLEKYIDCEDWEIDQLPECIKPL